MKLTHFDAAGKARMVDVSGKKETAREAVASGMVMVEKGTLELIANGQIGKGDVLGIARTAGIMAAKRTPDLIPLCHPLPLSSVTIDFVLDEKRSAVLITSTARVTGRTGVEMEALTATSIAALTIYDMCKAVDKGMVIGEIMLLEKRGGKSGAWRRKG